MARRKRLANNCLNCRYVWTPKGEENSERCPRCKSQNVEEKVNPMVVELAMWGAIILGGLYFYMTRSL